MAKSATDELFETLRARGLRRRAARVLSEAAGAGMAGAGRSQEAARSVLADLRKVADDVEGRITGKQTSSNRSEAAQKAAKTREKNANQRSAAAKKGAATRKAKRPPARPPRARRRRSRARRRPRRVRRARRARRSSTAKSAGRTAKSAGDARRRPGASRTRAAAAKKTSLDPGHRVQPNEAGAPSAPPLSFGHECVG